MRRANTLILIAAIASTLPAIHAGEAGEPLSEFLDKNSPKTFDVNDPLLEKFYAGLRKSVRYEVEEGDLSAIDQFIFGHTPINGYRLIRGTLAEYHLRVYPVADVSPPKTASLKRAKDLTALLHCLLRWDVAIFYGPPSIKILRTDYGEETARQSLTDRLAYLTQLVRQMSGETEYQKLAEEALIRLALTPDARAQVFFREEQARIDTDAALLAPGKDAATDPDIALHKRQVAELIKLNQAVVEKGVESALVASPLTKHQWLHFSEDDVPMLLLSEYRAHPEEGYATTKHACDVLHEQFEKAKGTDQPALKKRAKAIVTACIDILPRGEHLDKLSDDRQWFNQP